MKFLQRLAEPEKKSVEPVSQTSFYDYWLPWYDFYEKYLGAMLQASSLSFVTFLNARNAPLQKIENAMRASFDSALRDRLGEEAVCYSLARLIDSQVELAEKGYNNIFINFSDMFSRFNRLYEPFRDTINRTPSEIISLNGRFHLHHYKSDLPKKYKTPILVVYSLINRHYILDLLPQISVINKLLQDGFDVYATDWGTPSFPDRDMTLENYAHEYVENAVDKIKEITGKDKITLFGYCWGGIFSLIYSCIHPENVRNLVLHATPSDFDKLDTTIEKWTVAINTDRLVDTFGNVPGFFLNLAFVLRNPVESLLKYWRYFSEPRSMDEILQFFAIEGWLYDNIPIIGEVYREIIDQIYKENLLIKNKMKIGQKSIILSNLSMPVLSIIGTKDDLVPPNSSKKIMEIIPSSDKNLIEFSTGHVGLCISQKAHEKLWPQVTDWLAKRS